MNNKIEHMRVPSDPGTITLDGACFKTYVKDLASETSEESARQVEGKAAEVVRNCGREYSAAYGTTDVGASGSGHVSSPSKEAHTLNGLLYGRVQSGKTNSSIAAVALACANGFRCFVVLTSDNTLLGKQTDRFRDQLGKGDGPIVRPWDDWRSDPKTFADEVKEYLEDTGVVLVSTKNGRNLENLITVLKRMGAARVPGLILDDEACRCQWIVSNPSQVDVQSGSYGGFVSRCFGVRSFPNSSSVLSYRDCRIFSLRRKSSDGGAIVMIDRRKGA